MKKKILFGLFFVSTILMSQNTNYQSLWEEVKSMEDNGFLKKVLPKVETIYSIAKKENQSDQIIKSLLYKSKIILITSDEIEGKLQVVNQFRNEIQEANQPRKAILQSMLAEMLQNYLQQNQYKIRDRTNVEETKSDDFRTWTHAQFLKECSRLYDASILDSEKLKNSFTQNWAYILVENTTSRSLKPTLYDLLVHRAIKFYDNSRFYYFPSQEQKLLGDRKQKVTKLYSDLIHFHQRNSDARLYNQHQSLKYQKQQSEINTEEYIQELNNLNQKNHSSFYRAHLLMDLATSYKEHAQSSVFENNDDKKKFLDFALKVCSEIQSKHTPNKKMVENAKIVQNKILRPSFQIELESFLPTNEINPMSVSHQNLHQIYVKVLRANRSLKEKTSGKTLLQNKSQKEINHLLKKYPLVQEVNINLNDFNDYQNHTTWVKLDKLDLGEYLILASSHKDFKASENSIFKYQFINVTNASIISRNISGGKTQIYLTNRSTGKPIPNQIIQVFSHNYKKGLQPKGNIKTDTNGFGSISLGESYNNYYQLENQPIHFSSNNYFFRDYAREKTTKEIKIFTDRAIYRPGQVVYFKLITYQKDKEKNSVSVLKNYTDKIKLYNPNEKIESVINFKTNDFGSAEGKFILPSGGITGEFHLLIDGLPARKYLRVEEYKRSKFSVDFEPIKQRYLLENTITANGKAQSFSGAKISDAKVSYRVFRQAIYPYRSYWSKSNPPNEPEKEITYGETITDKNGSFKINFLAKAAKRKKKGENRTYTYRVVADVTDINGETRTGNQSISVGDQSIVIDFDIQREIELDQFKELEINTKNLNNEFYPTKGEIKLTKIRPPERILRNIVLTNPDYNLYPKEEFIQYFPYDSYNDESAFEKRKLGKVMFDIMFDTKKSQTISLPNTEHFVPGYYWLQASIKTKTDSIYKKELIFLYPKNQTQSIEKQLYQNRISKRQLQPGEEIELTLSSAAKNANVWYEIEHKGDIIETQSLTLNNEAKVIKIPILESYRGGFHIKTYFGKYNRAKGESYFISVPFLNKKLKITTSTFRDKLLPGQQETWELKIEGPDRDKIMAELLATMYDASLDEFISHDLFFSPYQFHNASKYGDWNSNSSFATKYLKFLPYHQTKNYFLKPIKLDFDYLNWFGFDLNQFMPETPLERRMEKVSKTNFATVGLRGDDANDDREEYQQDKARVISKENNLSKIKPRKNLQETAFFFPNLKTDKEGNIKFQFTAPESLTKWNFMALAHTKDLKTENFTAQILTQKDLMVVPNPPRFLREGDEIYFTSKVVNLSNKDLAGEIVLNLEDPFSTRTVNKEFKHSTDSQKFQIKKGQSQNFRWKLHVPDSQQIVTYKVLATTHDGVFTDGEESVLPILTNRMLVTETLPLHLREGQNKTFTLKKLRNTKSNTRKNHKLTLEMTTNPIWYAILSLPYLREYPYECSEQVFSRLYSNMISQSLINSSPKIKAVFDSWNQNNQLVSPLERNQELKSLLLEETPWIRQAQSEAEQQKRISVLFELNTMQRELQSTFQKLEQKQYNSGGFSWFDGGTENNYISTHILAGFGHLKQMNIKIDNNLNINSKKLIGKLIQFVDKRMIEQYKKSKKSEYYKISINEKAQYLYARSYFLDEFPIKNQKLKTTFLKDIEKEKLTLSLQMQAIAALVLHRNSRSQSAKQILASIKDYAVDSEEFGMYWKENKAGWFWYNAPIETQALLIEAFDEVLQDIESVESMKVWLLKNRQTNRWSTTKATAEAVYALMNTGKDWTDSSNDVQLKIGGEELDLKSIEDPKRKGSGYIKTSWKSKEIKPKMAEIEINKTSPGIVWGSLYWQYFENLDKITFADTNIKMTKKIYREKNTENGPVLQEIIEETPIEVGDKVKVRLTIQTDRDMEFIHIKDMRASGFEPINVLSEYKYQGGLGYYESTRDAATNFFIDFMKKGIYVFEYDLRANNAGNFSNGTTTLQNMYAPEFTSHSQGIRVKIN